MHGWQCCVSLLVTKKTVTFRQRKFPSVNEISRKLYFSIVFSFCWDCYSSTHAKEAVNLQERAALDSLERFALRYKVGCAPRTSALATVLVRGAHPTVICNPLYTYRGVEQGIRAASRMPAEQFALVSGSPPGANAPCKGGPLLQKMPRRNHN